MVMSVWSQWAHEHGLNRPRMSQFQPILLVHGGAGALTMSHQDQVLRKEKIQQVVRRGYEVLIRNKSALDAVEAAVVAMEDDFDFNAGCGSVLNDDGHIEMDALIMEGDKMAAGSVGAISNVKNPIKVSRHIMENTHHCLLVGDNATKYAIKNGFQTMTTEEMTCDKRVEHLKKFHANIKGDLAEEAGGHDTVGAVAMDENGNLAAATSTGGLTGKIPGRVGDSPVIGAGGFCDNKYGAVSTTGHGEDMMKTNLARHVVFYLEQGFGAQEAVESAVRYMEERIEGYGAAIVISAKGESGLYTNTKNLTWASIKDNHLHYGLHSNETCDGGTVEINLA